MRLVVLLICFALTASAWGQGLEIITLRHRTAEQLLPQIQPMVEPGGALTGSGDKLFLRTSPRNQMQVRQVIEALDRPLRRLMITVRQGEQGGGDKVSADGTVILRPGDSSVRGNVGERRYSSRQSSLQQVQTVEGGQAMISVGRSFALPFRQVTLTPGGAVVSGGLVWQEVGSGFQAAPRIVGDRVILDISPSHISAGPLPHSTEGMRLTTSVAAPLGTWVSLGGTTRDTRQDRAGTLSYGTRHARDDREVWLKVEELP